MFRRLAGRALRSLATDRLIQAVGNVELRDGFEWLRAEMLAEVDRCVADPVAIHAFEHAMAGTVMGMVLERAYLERRHPIIVPWVDDFVRRYPHVAAAAIARNLIRHAISRRPALTIPPTDPRALAAACAPGAERADSRRGLVVTRDVDQRMRRIVGGLLRQIADAGVAVTWLRVSGRPTGLRVGRAGDVVEVDVAAASLRAPWDGRDLDLSPLHRCAAAGDPFAARMVRPAPALVEHWAAGRLFGRHLLARGDHQFVFFISEKYPFARGLITEARAARVPTFAYFPSIELGAPSIYRYAVDRLLVPNAWTLERLAALGFARDRLQAVGTTEIDDVLDSDRSCNDLPDAPLRMLFLTKWPDCAIRNKPILEAALAACADTGRPFHAIVRPHPKDRTSYRGYESERVQVSDADYQRQLAWANVVVLAGMSNSVFHGLALGKPMVIVSTNPRIDLGERQHLFNRGDLPDAVRYSADLDSARRELLGLIERGLPTYTLPDTLVSQFFHALDGGTCARIGDALLGRVEAPVLA
jgi:hypothetical protein